ncbi:unnamed protein product [Dracunculus medinensis]|uniref:Dynactin subunit 4 n=1 Tax=Dracunculus medinensis TaxID=318479 RepID=A0A0N4U176_DRAME|nr:unnamed protein product [Dracunculus medinensis]
MASLNSIDEVLYECSCGEWKSLNRLYFCRYCSELKCSFCTIQEMDSPFCPSCLYNYCVGDALQQRNRCSNCYQCPLCGLRFLGVGVVVRAANDCYHLSCNNCRWTTSDSGIPDMNSSTGWPEYTNDDEDLLNSIVESMRNFASIEGADHIRHKYMKRRSNLGALSNRFGLQAIYNRHKNALVEQNKCLMSAVTSTDLVPKLDLSIFTEAEIDPGSIPTLMQRTNQPFANDRLHLPNKVRLICRRSMRCKQCDHSLCKGEYNSSSVQFKIQVLAGNIVPDLRLSRPATLVAGHICPIFLTVSNFSSSPTKVAIMGDIVNDPSFVKCETPVVEFSIPNCDEEMDLDDISEKQPNENEAIIFRKRHRFGIRLMVCATEGHKKFLALIIKYSNSSTTFETMAEQNWLQHRVKIALGDSPFLNQ